MPETRPSPHVPARVLNDPFPSGLIDALALEVERQDQKWGLIEAGHSAAAVRLGLALIADEFEEALEAWSVERRLPGRCVLWSHTQREVLQLAAIAVRTLRDTL